MAFLITNSPTSSLGARVPPSTGPSQDVRASLIGALGGLIGTIPMSVAMLVTRRFGLLGRLPPQRITERAFFRGLRRPQRGTPAKWVAALLHFGFGGVSGALFGVVQSRLPRKTNPMVDGMLFGTLVWAVSYVGWAPALGLMPPVHRDRPDRPVVMVLAHWIFGATLGAVVNWLA